MEFTGKIIAVCMKRSGVSAKTGKQWSSQDYVIEELNQQYPNSIVFNVFGEDRINELHIQQNEIVTVHFSMKAEGGSNGYFQKCNAWKVTRFNGQNMAQQPQQMQQAQPVQPSMYSPAPFEDPFG